MEQDKGISLFYENKDYDSSIFVGFEDLEPEEEGTHLLFYCPDEHNKVVFAGLESVLYLLGAHEEITMAADKAYDPVKSRQSHERMYKKLGEYEGLDSSTIPLGPFSEIDDWNKNADITTRLLGLIMRRVDSVRSLQCFFTEEGIPTAEHLELARAVLMAGLLQPLETHLWLRSDEHNETIRDALQPLTGYGSLYPFDFDLEFMEPSDDGS